MSNFRVPYLVGNKLGRDHQYWPTLLRSDLASVFSAPPTTDEQDSQWPVDISLAQMLALFWRVREWSFEGSASVNILYGNVDPSSIGGSCDIPATDFVTKNGDNEEIISEPGLLSVGGASPFGGLRNGGINQRDDGDFVSNWNETGDYGDFSGSNGLGARLGGFSLFDPETKLFSPAVNGISSISSFGLLGGHLILLAQFHRSPQTVTSGSGPLFLKAPANLTMSPGLAPDFDIPIQLSWRLDFMGTGIASSGSGSGDFTMTATKWWKNRNSRGQYVYDESTGEQVNDPYA